MWYLTIFIVAHRQSRPVSDYEEIGRLVINEFPLPWDGEMGANKISAVDRSTNKGGRDQESGGGGAKWTMNGRRENVSSSPFLFGIGVGEREGESKEEVEDPRGNRSSEGRSRSRAP